MRGAGKEEKGGEEGKSGGEDRGGEGREEKGGERPFW